MRLSHIFFQAEDGIRDIGVTGVQTCALQICRRIATAFSASISGTACRVPSPTEASGTKINAAPKPEKPRASPPAKIGRASCRERVQISVVAVSLNKIHIEVSWEAFHTNLNQV